jgi:hypothetical protein
MNLEIERSEQLALTMGTSRSDLIAHQLAWDLDVVCMC